VNRQTAKKLPEKWRKWKNSLANEKKCWRIGIALRAKQEQKMIVTPYNDEMTKNVSCRLKKSCLK
jgi:hypothetical protein